VLPIRKILCPTDFSEPSYEALQSAIELASYFHAELCVAHVMSPVPPVVPSPAYLPLQEAEAYSQELREDAEKRLRDIIKHRIPSELVAQSVVGLGDAATEIGLIAETEGVDVIIISTHGLTGWRHFVFGSVAEKIVRLAHRPVLVIPTSHPNDAE
jgi:nucleotide-binding universal stress UspA family protein